MSCYIYQTSPVTSLMDRRKSFPRVNSRDSRMGSIDIDFVSSLYNNNGSPTPMINDFFSAKLQELDLGRRHSEFGSLDQLYYQQYYSSSPGLSSNSSQSSRRQSFSSTTSNSCCNQSTSNSIVISCCVPTFKNSQGQSPRSPYQNSPGSKKFCASLLRARLLNMSESEDEKPRPRKSPGSPSDNLDHDHDVEPDREHLSRRRRQSSISISADECCDGKHPDLGYPCVGPFEKKRRIAREQRLSESADCDPDSSTESALDRPSDSAEAEATATSPKQVTEGRPKSVQQQPINLCMQDEEIALSLAMVEVERLNLNGDTGAQLVINEEAEESNDDQDDGSVESWTSRDRSAYPGGESTSMSRSLPNPSGSALSGYSRLKGGTSASTSNRDGQYIISEDSEPRAGTSASFYSTQSETGPSRNLHLDPSRLYQSSDNDASFTTRRSPAHSGSSCSNHYQSADSGTEVASVTVPLPYSSRRRISPSGGFPDSQAGVPRHSHLQPLPTHISRTMSRFTIGLDDSHSQAHIQGMSRAHARDNAMSELLQECQTTEIEEPLPLSRMNQRDRMRATQLCEFEHRPPEEFRPMPRAPRRQEVQAVLTLRTNPGQQNLSLPSQSHEEVPMVPTTVSPKKGTGKGGAGKKQSPKKVLQCPDCPKVFSQLRNFRYHRSRHEGTNLFQCTCPVCGKKFNDKGYLSSHLKIHTNAKEYHCEWCEKSFNQRVAYNMHVRIHTGVKPHACHYCDKAFSRKMLLRQHTRTHTGERPYTCSICGKAFADRSNMLLHQKLHSGNRPYACTQCDKTFSKNHHLKTHLNHHLGIKPYSCEKCGHSFSQSSNMKTHMKKCKLVKPPTVRAVKTPVPGKAISNTPVDTNKKKRGRKPKNSQPSRTSHEAIDVEENEPIPTELAPSTLTDADDTLAENVIQTRDRAMSMDSTLRPTVIQVTKTRYKLRNPQEWTENVSGSTPSLSTTETSRTQSAPISTPTVNTSSAQGSRRTPRVNRSLQNLHQSEPEEYFSSPTTSIPIDPNSPNPRPPFMLSARRFSDYSAHAATIRSRHDFRSVDHSGRPQMQMPAPGHFVGEMRAPYHPMASIPNRHPMTPQQSHHQMTSQPTHHQHNFAIRPMYQHNPRVVQPTFQVPQPSQIEPIGGQHNMLPPQISRAQYREEYMARMDQYQALDFYQQMGRQGATAEYCHIEQRPRSQSFVHLTRPGVGSEGQCQQQSSLPTFVERPRNRSPAQAARVSQQGQGHHQHQLGMQHLAPDSNAPHRMRSYSETFVHPRHQSRQHRQGQNETRLRMSDPVTSISEVSRTSGRIRSRSRSRTPEDGRRVQVKEEVYMELLAAEQAQAEEDGFARAQEFTVANVSPNPIREFEQEIKIMEAYKLSPQAHVSDLELEAGI